MASRIQGWRNQAGNGAAPLVTTSLSPIHAGNFIAVCVTMFNQPGTTVTVGDNRGNTYHQAGGYSFNAATTTQAALFYAYNISAGGTCQITVTPNQATFLTVACGEYSGVQNASDPLDQVSTNANPGGANTTITTGVVVVTQANELVVGALACDSIDTDNPYTAQAWGFFATLGQAGSFVGLLAGDGTFSSNINMTVLLSATDFWATVGASFKVIPLSVATTGSCFAG